MLEVKVCCGTSCYIMGASELIQSEVCNIPGVKVSGSTCMNLCKIGDQRPPYVKIGYKTYSQVTPSKFETIVKENLDAL